MCSSVGDRTCLLPGFPIRKSSDQSSVDSSPRLIAASYVLHRLLVPRHPPCALNNLATKMLASTVQFSRYGRSRSPEPSRTAAAPKCAGRRSTGDRAEGAPLPQDPTACLRPRHLLTTRSHLRGGCTCVAVDVTAELVSVPPMSTR